MFWVLVLTFVALYALSIVTTRMMHGITATLPDETRGLFATIPASMFSLFAVMNKQDWAQINPLLELLPWTKPIFVIFTIYCSWALLSVMTGVVSDNMHCVREQQRQRDEEALEDSRQAMRKALAEIFAAADPD